MLVCHRHIDIYQLEGATWIDRLDIHLHLLLIIVKGYYCIIDDYKITSIESKEVVVFFLKVISISLSFFSQDPTPESGCRCISQWPFKMIEIYNSMRDIELIERYRTHWEIQNSLRDIELIEGYRTQWDVNENTVCSNSSYCTSYMLILIHHWIHLKRKKKTEKNTFFQVWMRVTLNY